MSRSSGLSCDALVIKVCGCQSEEESGPTEMQLQHHPGEGLGHRLCADLLLSFPFLPSSSNRMEGKAGHRQQHRQQRRLNALLIRLVKYWVELLKGRPLIQGRETSAAETLFVAKPSFVRVLRAASL